jgi:AraC-like DNA-binding protein
VPEGSLSHSVAKWLSAARCVDSLANTSHRSRDAFQVDVVAYLSDPLLHVFRSVTATGYTLHVARTVQELDTLLTLRPASAAVVDPLAPGLSDPRMLLPIFERHAAVQVVVYTTVTPVAMRGYGMLAGAGVRHLVVRGVDDFPEQFRDLLEALPADTLSGILLTMLEPLLAEVTAPLARALQELFRAPHVMGDINAVARAAGMPRRTFDRALERAGFAPADMLYRTARVVRAYHYMRSTRTRLKDIAIKLGYGTPRALTSEVYLVTGFLPSSLKNELEPEDLLARVAARLWRHGCPPNIVVPDVPAGLSSNAPRPGSRR